MKEFEIKQKDETYDLLVHVADLIESGGCRVKVTSISKKRSSLQNKSIFKYYRVIAEKLNDAGLTSRSFFEKLREGFEIAVSMENVRDVAEKVSQDMFSREVKDLSTVEIQELHKTVDRGFSVSMGVGAPFPSDQAPVYEGVE